MYLACAECEQAVRISDSHVSLHTMTVQCTKQSAVNNCYYCCEIFDGTLYQCLF